MGATRVEEQPVVASLGFVVVVATCGGYGEALAPWCTVTVRGFLASYATMLEHKT